MSLRQTPTLTPAMLAANRRNAEKSTGPRTEEGKRRVRLNSLKHGLRCTKKTVDSRRYTVDGHAGPWLRERATKAAMSRGISKIDFCAGLSIAKNPGGRPGSQVASGKRTTKAGISRGISDIRSYLAPTRDFFSEAASGEQLEKRIFLLGNKLTDLVENKGSMWTNPGNKLTVCGIIE